MILFRANCSPAIGTGHLNRVLVVAMDLMENQISTLIVTDDNELAREATSRHNGPVVFVPETTLLPENTADLRVLVLDCPPRPEPLINSSYNTKVLSRLNDAGVNIVSLGHISRNSKYFRAIIDLYPHREIHAANYHEGPDYLILKKEFANRPSPPPKTDVALISMGGSDPHDLTFKSLHILEFSQFEGQVHVVLGPGYCEQRVAALQDFAATSTSTIHFHKNIKNMREMMCQVSFGIVAFGTTAYEMMSQERPIMVFSHYQWQEQSALLFEQLGCCRYLGCAEHAIDPAVISPQVDNFLSNKKQFQLIATQGRAVVDCRGARRVATMLENFSGEKEDNQLDVLFVLAHPGDELFGCGGTLLKHVSAGERVGLIILGEGVSSRIDESDSPSTILNVRKEIRTSLQTVVDKVGIKDWYYYRFEDNRFDKHDLLDIIKVIESVLKRHKPKTLYTHHPTDLNIDHRRTFEAAITAARPTSNQCVEKIFSIEVPSSSDWGKLLETRPFKPNWFVEISDVKETKLKLLEHYTTELREPTHPRSIVGIAERSKHWGRLVGRADVEAFELQRFVDK